MSDHCFSDIVGKINHKLDLTPSECKYLLSFPLDTPETDAILNLGRIHVLQTTKGIGSLAAQIGIQIGPCHADCGFCSFASGTTDMENYLMDKDALGRYLSNITASGEISCISLMTIHDFDLDHLLSSVRTAKQVLGPDVILSVNTGDLSPEECKSLKRSGVDRAYHAIRLGESLDNYLEPLFRYRTIKNLLAADIAVYTGVEPIGPEHSPEDIVDLYYRSYDMGCTCCSASAQVTVPGTRMVDMGTISPERLELIRYVLMFGKVSCNNGPLGYYGGFYGGLGEYYAEYSSSPKDNFEISEHGLGHNISWAKSQLKNEGFSMLRKGDKTLEKL